MKLFQLMLIGLASSIFCMAQNASCKVVVDSAKLFILFDGKKHEIQGEALPIDSLAFKVEPKLASVVQYVYVWEIEEDQNLEDEYGKCYSMYGHRLEFHPKDSAVKMLKGDEIVLWGSKKIIGDKIILNVKKIRGLATFASPQEIKLDRVQKLRSRKTGS